MRSSSRFPLSTFRTGRLRQQRRWRKLVPRDFDRDRRRIDLGGNALGVFRRNVAL
jgi:hypothetical protein